VHYAGDPADLLDLVVLRPVWHRDAACREHPELTWFPERGEHQGPRARCARAVWCAPNVSKRLREHHGFWAGTSERERCRVRVARGEVVVGVPGGETKRPFSPQSVLSRLRTGAN